MDVSQAGGIVEINQTIPNSYPATFTFTDNESIRLEAIPPQGYYFTNWSGDISNTNNPIIMMMDCNKSITANFDPIIYNLTININGNGSISPAEGKHSYPEGTVVSISATPDESWHFDSWTGDIYEQDVPHVLLIMDSDKTVTANFLEIKLAWWFITGIIAGILAIAAVVWLLVKKRAALYRIVLKHCSVLK